MPEPSSDNSLSARWRRRAAAAEVNGRRINEEIERGNREAGAAEFVCECGHLGCSTRVKVSIAEYEAVRSRFDRFLIVPGHEIDQVDGVVERHPTYLVVVKLEGQARAMARAADERT